jgi:hypothetical protein
VLEFFIYGVYIFYIFHYHGWAACKALLGSPFSLLAHVGACALSTFFIFEIL